MPDANDHISRRRMLFGGGARDRTTGPPPGSAPASREETEPSAAPAAPAFVHRPPGAVDEETFLRDCTRCGDCITACPVDAIVVAGERHGPAAGTPIIDPPSSPCVMCNDTPCIPACAPGVLRADRPLRMGTARIRPDSCLAFGGTLCTVCSERCPVDGALRVGAGGRPEIAVDTCTGCGVCQYVCPAPYNAVLILPDERRDPGGRPSGPEPAPEPARNAPAPPATFDWRAAYFGERSLRAPENAPGREIDGPDPGS